MCFCSCCQSWVLSSAFLLHQNLLGDSSWGPQIVMTPSTEGYWLLDVSFGRFCFVEDHLSRIDWIGSNRIATHNLPYSTNKTPGKYSVKSCYCKCFSWQWGWTCPLPSCKRKGDVTEIISGCSSSPSSCRAYKRYAFFHFIHNDLLRHLVVEDPPLKPEGAVTRQRAFPAYLYFLLLSLAPSIIQDRGLISLIPLFLVVKAQCAVEGDSLLGQSLL